MRPLQLVNPRDLKPGKKYLIQEKRPEYRHLKSIGTFVKNVLPVFHYQCIMSHFTNVIVYPNNQRFPDLRLQDLYWNYYEADAVERAFTSHVLRQITGDPDFFY
jgi:hypothetical protein